jgi:hypothetical protein
VDATLRTNNWVCGCLWVVDSRIQAFDALQVLGPFAIDVVIVAQRHHVDAPIAETGVLNATVRNLLRISVSISERRQQYRCIEQRWLTTEGAFATKPRARQRGPRQLFVALGVSILPGCFAQHAVIDSPLGEEPLRAGVLLLQSLEARRVVGTLGSALTAKAHSWVLRDTPSWRFNSACGEICNTTIDSSPD